MKQMSMAAAEAMNCAPTDPIGLRIGPLEFTARLETERAPCTCAAFVALLPFHNKVIHVRWSGGACWVPLDRFDLGVGFENNTSHPAPGQVLFYPGGLSQTEILIPYEGCTFSSHVGQLSGNHFLTVMAGADQLPAVGHLVLWEGAQDIAFYTR